ncbi:transmembrane protein, putative (macronuclear) [Tetrahymena thermophila SB210]|uniref:Transmembrane protein, putative n=1 Tax=Tetrahymena thermophila (strain SB210) TaxID=312017 RepID=W7XKZ3_TETTS|nr:transmembrane protein, putative [Tetrahymena thermophila SB210]EWS75389.1 transmembrane protein, putative [Tetrahymena thermophila SB210]|eukprot:XP_012652063.1 transmembrane protein, putative [Tetrahymena thermophila SB210]
MVLKKLLVGWQVFLYFFIQIIDIVLSDQTQIDSLWFELKEQNALIVKTLPDQKIVYWQLDSQGYIQKQVNLIGCQCPINESDKSFVDQDVLYIFIYNTGVYYTAQFNDIKNALDKSSYGFYIIYQQFIESWFIVRKDLGLNIIYDNSSPDSSNVIIKKRVNLFYENDSKWIIYSDHDDNKNYAFWKGVQYLIPFGEFSNYQYYLIDENSQLFFDGLNSIYKLEFDNTNKILILEKSITLDQGSIFSQPFTIPGYQYQVIVVYINQQLQLYDTQTLNQLYSIENSLIDKSSVSKPFNLILTYQNVLIVGTNKYTLAYQQNAFSSQKISINNKYLLPCTDIVFRKYFQSILFDSNNYYFITMDDLVCLPSQYMDSKQGFCI